MFNLQRRRILAYEDTSESEWECNKNSLPLGKIAGAGVSGPEVTRKVAE